MDRLLYKSYTARQRKSLSYLADFTVDYVDRGIFDSVLKKPDTILAEVDHEEATTSTLESSNATLMTFLPLGHSLRYVQLESSLA